MIFSEYSFANSRLTVFRVNTISLQEQDSPPDLLELVIKAKIFRTSFEANGLIPLPVRQRVKSMPGRLFRIDPERLVKGVGGGIDVQVFSKD